MVGTLIGYESGMESRLLECCYDAFFAVYAVVVLG